MQTYNLKRATATSTPTQAAIPGNASPPDFDFQMPCRYFKSSFARSLSLNNNNIGVGAALALSKRGDKPQQLQTLGQQQQQNEANSNHLLANDNESPPPALPARRPTNNSVCNFGLDHNLTHFSAAPANQLATPTTTQLQQQHRNPASIVVWPLQQDANTNGAAPHGSGGGNNNHNNFNLAPQQATNATSHEQTLNVEAVILQNQVDTLHWQLKQTETNCEMYRAVMEEVARFFERYQMQQQQLRQQQNNRNSLGAEQIARSKSLHHVHGVGGGAVDSEPNGPGSENGAALSCSSASYLRARSSTNLMLNKSQQNMSEEHNYETIAPAGSYNAFKDFTWRRSPKKPGGAKSRLSALDDAEEKLNQEAFRLARTIRNLLHTSQQQPDLTQPRHSLSSLSSLALGGIGRLCKANTSSVLTLLAPPLHNSTSIQATAEAQATTLAAPPATAPKSNAAAEMLFLRANNMRDSRLSLRSSTDSSVHSTISSTASSSSKIETDEEATSATATNKQSSTSNANGSSTEDESGFSSISSFHDVGLPLSSTLIGGRRLSLSTESRNSTLKSSLAAAHPNNVVGVPLPPSPPQHSPTASTSSSQTLSLSPSKTYRNASRYQRFSTLSNEDAAAVLWV